MPKKKREQKAQNKFVERNLKALQKSSIDHTDQENIICIQIPVSLENGLPKQLPSPYSYADIAHIQCDLEKPNL